MTGCEQNSDCGRVMVFPVEVHHSPFEFILVVRPPTHIIYFVLVLMLFFEIADHLDQVKIGENLRLKCCSDKQTRILRLGSSLRLLCRWCRWGRGRKSLLSFLCVCHWLFYEANFSFCYLLLKWKENLPRLSKTKLWKTLRSTWKI